MIFGFSRIWFTGMMAEQFLLKRMWFDCFFLMSTFNSLFLTAKRNIKVLEFQRIELHKTNERTNKPSVFILIIHILLESMSCSTLYHSPFWSSLIICCWSSIDYEFLSNFLQINRTLISQSIDASMIRPPPFPYGWPEWVRV